MSLSARFMGMEKTPKSILEEQNAKRKPFGARLDWGDPKDMGDGRFSVACSFTRESRFPPIQAIGYGQGKKNAEHEAAEKVLLKMGIRCDASNQNRSLLNSPQLAQCRSLQSPQPSMSIRTAESKPKNKKDLGIMVPQSSVSRDNNDARIAILVTAPDAKNYVGILQEFCVKQMASVPKYVEERKEDVDKVTLIFTTSCSVGDVRETGTAKQAKVSKKIAAYKMYCHYNVENSGSPKQSTSLELKKLTAAFQDVKINSRPKRNIAIKSPRNSLQRIPLIPPATDGETLQISDIIWMYTKKILGKGGFSVVFKGYKEDPSCQIAIKRVPQDEAEQVKNRERDILQHIKHHNLVSYYLTVIKDGYFYYVMELAQCSLDDWLNDGPHESDTLVKICKDVAMGLKELHRRGVVHRDVKPGNVLIFMKEVPDAMPIAKLTDFGISRVVSDGEEGAMTTSGDMGTQIFMPPEANPRMELFPSFDIFSLGILLCYVMTEKKHLFAVPGKEAKVNIRANILDNLPNWSLVRDKKFAALKNLLHVMVSRNPEMRRDMGVLLEHPFFWSTKECLDFLVGVSNDSKNIGSCNHAISKAAQGYLRGLPDWKLRLDDRILRWMEKRDSSLDEVRKRRGTPKDGWRKYSGTSIIHLINFIRDQQQHYSNWRSTELECEEVFGKNGSKYGSYFITTYPELPTLLYNVLQDSRLRGNETSRYYENNNFTCFQLRQ